jgi:hypothetical protein
MKSIRGLTLEDVSAVALFGDPKAGWQTTQELEIGVAKGRRFADSVLGRELFHRLPKHKCGKDCDTLTLLGAENFAFDRAYNPRAISLFEQRFTNGSNRLKLEESYPEAYKLGMRSNPRGYFTEWTDAFCAEGGAVLHDDLAPEELFGDGYLLELWQTFSSYVKDVQG